MTMRDSGQAAVESALTLPLVVFLALGALQLFMMLQARIVSEYAVYQAVRAGSLRHGDCGPMTDAAVLALLPNISKTNDADSLGTAFGLRRANRYLLNRDSHDGPIVELVRERPAPFAGEDLDFDQPGQLMRLEVRMLYWFRLRVPFVDWVMSRMFLVYFDLREFNSANPTMLVEGSARWGAPNREATAPLTESDWPGGPIGPRLRDWVLAGRYLFPIRSHFSMRMMTPAKGRYFSTAGCPL